MSYDRKNPYGFNNYRVTKKTQNNYKVSNFIIDSFWNDVIYSEEEEEEANEKKSKYKRYKSKNERN